MEDIAFETVAITYSQPETVVMLSMFTFYGIPAYAVGFGHAQVQWPLALALGGIAVRVDPSAASEARALLAEVAGRPAAIRPFLHGPGWVGRLTTVLLFLCGYTPPTRTASVLLLDGANRP